MVNCKLEIKRRKNLIFNNKREIINNCQKNIFFYATNKGCKVYENGTVLLAEVRSYKNIYLNGIYLGKMTRPVGLFSKEKSVFHLQTDNTIYQLLKGKVLNFWGETTYTLIRDGEIIAEMKSMQNLVFKGGDLIANIKMRNLIEIVVIFAIFLWMDNNYYLDQSFTT